MELDTSFSALKSSIEAENKTRDIERSFRGQLSSSPKGYKSWPGRIITRSFSQGTRLQQHLRDSTYIRASERVFLAHRGGKRQFCTAGMPPVRHHNQSPDASGEKELHTAQHSTAQHALCIQCLGASFSALFLKLTGPSIRQRANASLIRWEYINLWAANCSEARALWPIFGAVMQMALESLKEKDSMRV